MSRLRVLAAGVVVHIGWFIKAYFCRFALIMGQGIKNVVPHVVRFLYRIIKLYNVLSVTGSLEREHITLKARGIFAFFALIQASGLFFLNLHLDKPLFLNNIKNYRDMNIIVGDKGAISVLFPYMPLSCLPDCKIDFVEKKHSFVFWQMLQ